MKILVVVSEFPKITETFAIANVLHYLAEGHDARVFHLKPFRADEVVHDEARPVVASGFSFPWITGESGKALVHATIRHPLRLLGVLGRIIGGLWREPKRLAETLAIVPKSLAMGRFAKASGVDHIHAEFASHPATAAWIGSEVYGVPFSYSAHMYDIFVSQSLLAEKARKARFVRTISAYNRDFLARIPRFPADKIAIVRCGVDPTRFPAREKERVISEPFNITYVGSLQTRKGVEVLLKALALIEAPRAWHLTVHGGGPEAARLHAFASTALPERVTFTGPATMAQVKTAMCAADLVVIPSVTDHLGRSEGIPVVAMEALAAGSPVIASRLSGIPELVEDGVTGYLCQPGDPAELGQRIIHVMTHYDEARVVAERGRARVLQDYNIDHNAADLLKLMMEHRA